MSLFRDSIDFMTKLGIYDVVLPFLLVFTIVFAIMEKTKLFGTETGKDGKEYTRKNLSAMVAFVTGFFVVASTQLVSMINKTLSQVFLVLLLIVCFLMLAGSFHQQSKEGFFLDPKKGYYSFLMAVSLLSVIAIFLNALGWLDIIFEFARDNWNTSYVASVIFMAFIIGFIIWVTKEPGAASKDEKT